MTGNSDVTRLGKGCRLIGHKTESWNAFSEVLDGLPEQNGPLELSLSQHDFIALLRGFWQRQ